MRCPEPEVLLSGPAGTGKSRACLEKLHLLAEHVPGFRGLILRKTRESLSESALVTFEQHVVPAGHAILRGAQRRLRQTYRYPNGSEIVVGGLDKPGKIMSTEYDAAYVQEAIELTVDAWESITTRLRNGKLPWQQLMADTNPDRPTHWLKRRCDAGRTKLLESRHQDNPLLWDVSKQDWTAVGRTYLARLEALTGPRLQRLRFGRWVQSEGIVYEAWDPALHLVDRFKIPDLWPRILSVDFGYTNPFVCQWWAVDDDGRLYRYRELYQTKGLVEDHAVTIRNLTGGERIAVVICDHDAEDRATLERHLGLPTVPARKEVEAGVHAVVARLKRAGDGKPRVYFLRDSLIRRDPDLDERKRPCCTEEEFDGYVLDIKPGKIRETPVKADDHGMDALRYVIWTIDSEDVEGLDHPTTFG